MPKYAITKPNGKVITVTNASHPLDNVATWVPITDDKICAGDTIDNNTGALISKDGPSTAEQRQSVREAVRGLLRATDWTQTSDNLNAAKQLAWKTYRQTLRDNWAVAKADNNPLTAMAWPDPPGDPNNDGL